MKKKIMSLLLAGAVFNCLFAQSIEVYASGISLDERMEEEMPESENAEEDNKANEGNKDETEPDEKESDEKETEEDEGKKNEDNEDQDANQEDTDSEGDNGGETDNSETEDEEEVIVPIDYLAPVISEMLCYNEEDTNKTVDFEFVAEDPENEYDLINGLMCYTLIHYDDEICSKLDEIIESNLYLNENAYGEIPGENAYEWVNEKYTDLVWNEMEEAGSYSFSAVDSDRHLLLVSDIYGNIAYSEVCAENFCNVILDKPVVTIGTDKEYVNETVQVTITAKGNTNSAGNHFPITAFKVDSSEWSNDFSIYEKEDGTTEYVLIISVADKNKHEIHVVDSAGNESETSFSIPGYDANPPELINDSVNKAVTFTYANENKISKFLNTLGFGNFFTSRLQISVRATDKATKKDCVSDIKKCEISFISDSDNSKKTKSMKKDGDLYIYKLQADELQGFSGVITVSLIDNAGNTSMFSINADNSNLEQFDTGISNLTIDDLTPEISDLLPVSGSMFNDAFDVSFSINDKFEDDAFAGIASVEVIANGQTVLTRDYSREKQENDRISISVDPDRKSANGRIINWNNGDISIEIIVYDNAGNKVQTSIEHLYFDRTNPVITSVEVDGENLLDLNDTADGYAFFYKQQTEVMIEAKDFIGEDEAVSAGVNEIKAYLENCDGIRLYIGEDIEMKEIRETGSFRIVFSIPGGFKGHLYVLSDDCLGNEYSNSANKKSIYGSLQSADGVISLKGFVVETKALHSENESTDILLPDAVVKIDELPLYADDIEAVFDIQDSFSGLKLVEISIEENDRVNRYDIAVGTDGSVVSEIQGLKVVKEKGTNIVKAIGGSVVVDGNSNNILLTVKMEDMCGNVSVEKCIVGIDKSAPQAVISYDNNQADTDATGTYFNNSRVATIEISDVNISDDNIKVIVTRDEEKADREVVFSFINGRYVAEIEFNEDGVYLLEILFEDIVGNKGIVRTGDEVNAAYSFIVDTTAPKVSVEYDNNNSQNQRYFKENREARITIDETNLNLDFVDINVTAKKDGENIVQPKINWIIQEGTTVGTILYEQDGDYTFSVDVTDRAGNKNEPVEYGDSVAETEFTIDTVINPIEIDGIEADGVYPDKLSFKSVFEDINFDSVSVMLTKNSCYKNRNGSITDSRVDVTEDFIQLMTDPEKGFEMALSDIQSITANDGIYNLNVEASDKAGNITNSSIGFTVDRFGSFFTYDSYINELANQYVNYLDEELRITEYNPSKIEQRYTHFEITRDGQPVDNTQYTKHETETESGWYKCVYSISDASFKKNDQYQDGIYKISLSTKDSGGNYSEAASLDNDQAIRFILDTTAPVFSYINGLDKQIVKGDSQEVTFQLFDAIGMDRVEVFVNGNEVNADINAEDTNTVSGSFIITAGIDQKVEIKGYDLAGNEISSRELTVKEKLNTIDKVTVSENQIVLWYADKRIWIMAAAAAIVVISLIAVAYNKNKKRK